MKNGSKASVCAREHEATSAGPRAERARGALFGYHPSSSEILRIRLRVVSGDARSAVEGVRNGPLRDPGPKRYVGNCHPATRVRLFRHGLPSPSAAKFDRAAVTKRTRCVKQSRASVLGETLADCVPRYLERGPSRCPWSSST